MIKIFLLKIDEFVPFSKSFKPCQTKNLLWTSNTMNFSQLFTTYYGYISNPFLKACLDADKKREVTGTREKRRQSRVTTVNGRLQCWRQILLTALHPMGWPNKRFSSKQFSLMDPQPFLKAGVARLLSVLPLTLGTERIWGSFLVRPKFIL
jgi:hypothetical protein